MPNFTTRKRLQILSTTPTGDAGVVLNDNFTVIGDSITGTVWTLAGYDATGALVSLPVTWIVAGPDGDVVDFADFTVKANALYADDWYPVSAPHITMNAPILLHGNDIDPTLTNSGAIYFNYITGKARLWDGATWSDVATGSGGTSGYSGRSGFSGWSGTSGFSGLSGYSGIAGSAGSTGTSGFSGFSGYSGFSGISGFSGYSGKSGWSGYSGFSGKSGFSGAAGTTNHAALSNLDYASAGHTGFAGLSANTFTDYQTIDMGMNAVDAPLVLKADTVDSQPSIAFQDSAAGGSSAAGFLYFLSYGGGGFWFDQTFLKVGTTGQFNFYSQRDCLVDGFPTEAGIVLNTDDTSMYFSADGSTWTAIGAGGAGTSGFSGFSGVSGWSGFSGFSGKSGFSGIAGSTGSTGTSGFSGYSGISGWSGTSGYSGISGNSGFSGTSGTSGFSGFSGTSGFSGFSGYSGKSGFSGNSGYSGISGFSGWSGYSGTTPNPLTVTTLIETPVALTDAATIATAANTGSFFKVTLAGNRTLGNPTSATDGQILRWLITQDGTGSRTIALDTKFDVGLISVTASTGVNKRDYLTAIYSSSSDKFHVVGFVTGYA